MELCQNSNILSVILFIKSILEILCMVVPIILIVILTFKIVNMVLSSGNKDEISSILKKLVALACVFFVPVLVDASFGLIGMSGVKNSTCWIEANEQSVAKYKAIDESKKEEKQAEKDAIAAKNREEMKKQDDLRKQKIKENAAKKQAERNKRKKAHLENKGLSGVGNGYGGEDTCSGSYVGTKYDLTDDQITQLSRMVNGEYGSDINGMKAVASQMANLYELRKYYSYTGGKSMFEYITTCGWYATARIRFSSSYDSSLAKQAVEDVLVNGNRTLPLYIDEFDMFPGDIVGALNSSDYKSGITPIKNVYGSSGTYYCITTASSGDSNIFFYTPTAESYKSAKGY